jgi:hypothetical protein
MKPRHFLFAILSLVLAYPLSSGPVLGLNVRINGPEWVPRIYLPLVTTSPAIRDVMLAYIQYWIPQGRAANGDYVNEDGTEGRKHQP